MGRYRRTVSFQNPTPNPNPNPNPNLNTSKHVRSVSLPCGGTNPLIPHLRHQLTELRSWAGSAGSGSRSTRVVDGLTRLNSVLTTYDDVLQLPQTQDDVVESVERLLEDFLRFVDVYEMFRSTMLGFKQDISSAQVAVRRMDRYDLSHYITVHKKTAGEIGKLISTVGSIPIDGGDLHDEVAYVIKFVTESLLRSIGLGHTRKRNWAGFGFGIRKDEDENENEEEVFVKVLEGVERLMELSKKRKRNNNEKEEMKKEVMKKMEEMEKCVEEMEKEGEKVFRSLIISRVSLLNILTHA